MRRSALTIAVAGFACTVALAGGAGAAAASSATSCGFRVELAYDTPVTLGNADANFSSPETAVDCVGGHTGTGTVRLVGTAGEAPAPAGGESCVRGAGYGRLELRLPPLRGAPEVLASANFEYHHVAGVWSAEGRLTSPARGGALQLLAVDSTGSHDCLDGGRAAVILSGQFTIEGKLAGGDADAAGCTNRMIGSPAADSMRGTAASDSISGRGGADRIAGRGGVDCVLGGRGADRISSGTGPDTIRCGAGRDVVRADRGDDVAGDCEVISSAASRSRVSTTKGGPSNDRAR